MPRLFVAVWPPPDVIETLARLPRPEAPKVRWTAPDRLHVTLRFLGEADEDAAADALRGLRASAAAITLGPGVERLGKGVLMVPAQGAESLAAAAVAATGHLGQPPPDRPFFGHLTVARFDRRPPPGYGPAVEASFTASEIALVRVGRSGTYSTVERFAVHPAAEST